MLTASLLGMSDSDALSSRRSVRNQVAQQRSPPIAVLFATRWGLSLAPVPHTLWQLVEMNDVPCLVSRRVTSSLAANVRYATTPLMMPVPSY